MSIHPIEDLPCPFKDPDETLSDSELRQTAYEVLVGACRSGGGRPLTFTPQPERVSAAAPSSLQRSLTSAAARKVKRALSLGMKKRGGDSEGAKRAVTTGELIRVQMRVSEQVDSRVRRALLRIAAGQLGRRIESIVLPLELLQQFKITDFPNQQEFENWQIRNLKVLEAGLLSHPRIPLDLKDNAPQTLREIIHKALGKPQVMGRNSESAQALRNAAMSLAHRSTDGPETCHWADGSPFNLRLYRQLLEACFDVNDETSVIEEVDEVLELIKKTWTILGMSQAMHNVSFSWILLHRYVTTGQVENDLLFASSNLLTEEVEEDSKFSEDPFYSKARSSMLSSMLGWAEKRLLAYRDSFNSDNTETMRSIVSLAVVAATKMEGVDLGRKRVDAYIRSSLQTAFGQKVKKVSSSKRTPLALLAQEIHDLAINEKTVFSPILKRWHPLAAGVAAATLHASYSKELKGFVSSVTELTPDAIHVLRAADALEKGLVQIAVEDSADSEDGGKAVINEMPPYEAEAAIARLVDSWIRTRVEMLNEWLERNLQVEVWNPRANKERLAPSGVEVLRIVDETLEAFFGLQIPMHAVLLPNLMIGLDNCLQNYITKAKSGCGSRSSFIPAMPPLTRCSTGSRFGSVFNKKQRPNHKLQTKKPNGNKNNDAVPQLCVRINTLHHIRSQLGALENRTLSHLRSSDSTKPEDIARCNPKRLELSASSCSEAIKSLSEAAAYNVVFHELTYVFSDALYVGEPSNSRIEPFLVELEQYLEVIASTVHDRVRTRVISDVMRASFEGFLLVLLAGGPSRGFTRRDSALLEEDFRFLSDLFWSGGDGLPADLIGKCTATVKGVIPLFGEETEGLIERFMESNRSPAKGRRVPLPATSGRWSPEEANTIMRVLCYRNDEVAAKFLKKTYNFPTKL